MQSPRAVGKIVPFGRRTNEPSRRSARRLIRKGAKAHQTPPEHVLQVAADYSLTLAIEPAPATNGLMITNGSGWRLVFGAASADWSTFACSCCELGT